MASAPAAGARLAPASPNHNTDTLPPITENGSNSNSLTNQRRSSRGFLRRSKSTEPLGERKSSGSRKKMSKAQAMEEERRQRESAASKIAPRLPDLSPTPQLETFGGDDPAALAAAQLEGLVPPARPSSSAAEAVNIDPYARTESMTHRGRYSYASSAVSTVNSPRRLRRRKDPTPYK
jgi:hypothetical protein